MGALRVDDGRYSTTKIGTVLLHEPMTRANMQAARHRGQHRQVRTRVPAARQRRPDHLARFPGQLEDAKRELTGVEGAQRVSFHPTNLLDPESEIPSGFDAAPDGRIYVLEPFWDRHRFGAARFCLQMTSLYFTAVEEQHDGLGNSHTLLVCNRS